MQESEQQAFDFLKAMHDLFNHQGDMQYRVTGNLCAVQSKRYLPEKAGVWITPQVFKSSSKEK
ncbi:MAG TPA: hypothetical protein VK974_04800 [Methylophilaceae bacterium]|nr:hypothetical protein [Methylophilaceae bacterium]